MMNRKAVVITSTLSIVLIFCLASTQPNTKAEEPKPCIYVAPENIVFFASRTSIGATFNVNISAADWTAPDVLAYQARLCYNNTLLEAVAAEFPKNHWLEPSTPIFYFDGPPHPDIWQEQGFVSVAFTLVGEPGRTGGGTMVRVTFRIIEAPAPGQRLSCLLELADVVLVNPDAEVISQSEYDVINGNYVFSGKEDLNLDGRVNILDMAILAKVYGSHPEDARWNPKADLNGDGEINIIDFSAVARDWTW